MNNLWNMRHFSFFSFVFGINNIVYNKHSSQQEAQQITAGYGDNMYRQTVTLTTALYFDTNANITKIFCVNFTRENKNGDRTNFVKHSMCNKYDVWGGWRIAAIWNNIPVSWEHRMRDKYYILKTHQFGFRENKFVPRRKFNTSGSSKSWNGWISPYHHSVWTSS